MSAPTTPTPARVTAGIDPGTANFSLSLYDGTVMQVYKVDFTIQMIAGKAKKVKIDVEDVEAILYAFITRNPGVFETIDELAIEYQSISKAVFKEVANVMLRLVRELHPRIVSRFINPIDTRAFFGITVTGAPGLRGYKRRKALSAAMLPRLMSTADYDRLMHVFGEKRDDAADSSLLALYAHLHPTSHEQLAAEVAKERAKARRMRRHIGFLSERSVRRIDFECLYRAPLEKQSFKRPRVTTKTTTLVRKRAKAAATKAAA